MANINPQDLWFHTVDTFSLCRGGGNGPKHPSQLYAIRKYMLPMYEEDGAVSFLDFGCGSATTLEAWQTSDLPKDMLAYKGVDIIPKNVQWCLEKYPLYRWDLNTEIHKITEPDQSWDVVYSRHVVDHMDSFENGLNEHCRVAKKLVIIVLWRPFIDSSDHQIKNIFENGKTYPDEYTNDYSRSRVLQALTDKEKEGWQTVEIAEGVGKEVKGFDTVIVLRRKNEV